MWKQQSYTVEGQLYISCIQCGRSLVWADDWPKIIKARIDFNQESFVLGKEWQVETE